MNTIFSYPVIGGLWFPNGSGGGHSAILDTFAKYGLFGGYVVIKILFSFSLGIKKSPETGKDLRIANASFIVLFLIMLLNSIPFNFTCLLMLVIPVSYNDIVIWRKKNQTQHDDIALEATTANVES